MSVTTSGREIECLYKKWTEVLWPNFQFCYTSDVDFSAKFEAEKHTFTGTPSQKSETTTVWIQNSAKVDFIPLDILTEFPNLNGLCVDYWSLRTLKEGLLKQELKVIEYLWLAYNQIEVIEPKAFEHLTKLKWINLRNNKLRALPDRIFQNNPDLIYIDFDRNQISSIVPNFFDGLNKLKVINLSLNNICIQDDIGCKDCLITQSEIKEKLKGCFGN
jgi:Leucine-rich repeat (LRR) protein